MQQPTEQQESVGICVSPQCPEVRVAMNGKQTRSNACEETMMKLRVVIINITEQVVLAE